MNDGPQPRIGGRAGARQRDPDGERRDNAQAPELTSVLRIAEPQQREAGVSEQLCQQPAAGEQRDRL